MEAREIGDRRCLRCGAELECKLKNFSIGADGGGGLITFFADQYEVDLYACPACGKVELFTAGFSTQPQPEEETVTCPVCGTVHSPQINCPDCALRAALAGRTYHPPKPSAQEPGQEQEPPERPERRFPWQKKKVPWEK